MSAVELLEKARPLLDAIKANAEHGQALAAQRAELSKSFRGQLPPGVAESILQHHSVNYNALVFGLLPSEYSADLLHQIEAHAREQASRHAVQASNHGASK